MTTHVLKCIPPYFGAVWQGDKRFEVRKNDRGFQVGDKVFLHEYLPCTGDYTGRCCEFVISYILPGGQFGIEEGYCVLGLEDRQT